MKRFLAFVGTFALCTMVSGCSPDTHDGLVAATVNMMNTAATEVGVIKGKVTDAIAKANEGKKFDLTEAVEATKKLKETGDEFQKLKRRIEQVRSQISDEDKKENAKKHRTKLAGAFADLAKERAELNTALQDAERLSPAARNDVSNLRAKITEAESPFEALSRN
jgi:chromosome segregation ATPase